MALELWSILICLFMSMGCATYPRHLHSQVKKREVPSSYNISLSFIRHVEGPNPKDYRIDDDPFAKNVISTLTSLNLFRKVSTDFEQYQQPDDLVIEVIYINEYTRNLAELGLIVPVPNKKREEMTWIVYNKKGLKKKYSSVLEYEKYSFFPLFPYLIYKKLTEDEHYVEKLLTEETLAEINKDIENGTF